MKLGSTLDEARQALQPELHKWDSIKDEKKRRYHARYAEMKALGEQFFPYTIFKDVVASLVLFLILVALALFAGTGLEERADPTNTAYVPRPEWYFMFLFEMLKYFPGQFEWVGVALVPGILIALLFLLPLLDRGAARHPLDRRLAMNLTALSVLAIAFLTLRSYDITPTTAMSLITSGPQVASGAPAAPQAKLNAGQEAGKRLFNQNCSSCHQIAGAGNAAGPDLTKVGARRDAGWLHEYIENPKALNPAAVMPKLLPPLTHQEVEWVAQYLATLR